MASVDGSKSMLGASDEIIDTVCVPCKRENVKREAKHYCEDCQEHLCDACHGVHRNLKATKSHNIISGRYGPKVSLTSMKMQSVKPHFIKLDDDRGDAFISGCSYMPSGDLLLCDVTNSKLKLLDRTPKVKDSLSLNGRPWSLSVIDDINYLVTLPGSKQLQFVKLVSHMEVGRVIQLDKECWGVAVAGNEIYVSCHNDPGKGEVRVLELNGNLKRQLGANKDGSYQFQRPNYLTVSKTGKKIFVSDGWTSVITCMTRDGNIIYQYKDNGLRNPLALFVDDVDNIFVCCFISHDVHMITANGKTNRTQACIPFPYSTAFSETDNTLVVGCWSNNIFCYKVSL